MEDNLRIIVLDSAKELGEKVITKLGREDILVPIINDRFNNGEGKITIKGSVRDKDLYILTDVGNYSLEYQMHGFINHISPDEHFQDIKRVISATSGHAEKITVIMPLLYQSRQHKRKGRESLDCAMALQELEALGVNNIVTIDAHDPNVSNAIPKIPFDNFYPTNFILKELLDQETLDNILVVSPDMGAMERARYYAEMLGCDVGVFYKRRDLSKLVNGKNPIIEHTYMGADVKNKNIIVVDDMIASGNSMIEVARELKQKGANKVFLIATFALLTEGTKVFLEAYQNHYFDKLYTTNLSYVAEEIKKEDWYQEVDCSSLLSSIITTLHERKSLEEVFVKKLERRR